MHPIPFLLLGFRAAADPAEVWTWFSGGGLVAVRNASFRTLNARNEAFMAVS